jgi:hypothetical protein
MPGTTKERGPYRDWKRERDELWKGGEEAVNKARISAMGSMAAGFGRMRLKGVGKVEGVAEEGDEGVGDVAGSLLGTE